jgi:hypothetical protein
VKIDKFFFFFFLQALTHLNANLHARSSNIIE